MKDLAKIYPFTAVTGILGRKEKKKQLERQKSMPYTSNEGVVALQHFSAVIEDGEFVVLLGPSGSGKSTLLRMIAGLESISVGELYFNDQLMNSVPAQQRDVAMVFQNYALYPGQSVYENIAFPLQVQHMPREELDLKVREIAELLKLDDKLDRLIDELSGGEKQRVALARALVRKPKVFLMDEPFANLDEAMKNSLRREIKRLHNKLKTTFIYVTHDQYEALSLASRIIVLRDGVTQQNGSTEEVYNYPANRFVASFIGSPSMNIYDDIEVIGKGNKTCFELFGRTYPLETRTHLKNREKISVGIRPIAVIIRGGDIECEVDYTEIIGSDMIYHLKCAGREITCVEKIESDMPPQHFRGEILKIGFEDESFHFFDNDGKRID